MNVVVVDYGSGNLRSAAKALERAAEDADLGAAVVQVTPDPAAVRRADRIVLPGVGAFGDCRRGIEALDGMIEALQESVIGAGRPFLGICVGMQLMADAGLEHGRHPGLGWVAGEVAALDPADKALKIPHMGWNELRLTDPDHPVLRGLEPGTHVYFVHGFGFRPADPADVLAEVDYGGPVVAAVGRDNLVGTQFHPEKSQRAGLRLLANFLRWTP
jgi:glutamine amidotransferase